MTPQEKALELYNKLLPYVNDYTYPEVDAKKLCMITVDEILNMDYTHSDFQDLELHISYWEEVKKEIEKL